MWFLSSRVRFYSGIFLSRSSETDGERIVQRRYYVTPSPCFTNSYMLDPHIVENNDKKG